MGELAPGQSLDEALAGAAWGEPSAFWTRAAASLPVRHAAQLGKRGTGHPLYKHMLPLPPCQPSLARTLLLQAAILTCGPRRGLRGTRRRCGASWRGGCGSA